MGRKLPEITKEMVEKAWKGTFDSTAKQCHAVSLAVVKERYPHLRGGRVARGFCNGVVGQHSWIVLGNPYDSRNIIVDPTLWSYIGGEHKVYVFGGYNKRYMPHGGAGNLQEVGMPPRPVGEKIALNTGQWNKLSSFAQDFLSSLGPLDARGWAYLGNAPVHGWPSAEILSVAYENSNIRALIPIDRIGMLTDINPAGVYF